MPEPELADVVKVHREAALTAVQELVKAGALPATLDWGLFFAVMFFVAALGPTTPIGQAIESAPAFSQLPNGTRWSVQVKATRLS